MKKWIENRRITLLCFVFALTRLANLGKLPIFNDEAIYLDWGVRMWRYKEFFLSLYDGKPPLLMWIFGLVAKATPDPLMGGRMVSVGFGAATLVGIYMLVEKKYGEKTAWWAGMIYSLMPLFMFFDRQALMESAIGAIGIWTLIALLKLVENPDFKNSVFLVVLWTGGVWIKTNAILMVATSLGVLMLGTKGKRKELFGYWIFAVGLMLIMLLPLVIQSGARNIVSQNGRFSMTVNELLLFPIKSWLVNLWSIVMIGWWQVGLLLWIPAGIWLLKTKKKIFEKRLITWLMILLGTYVLLVKSPQPRYLVSFLPVTVVFLARAIDLKKRWVQMVLIGSMCWFGIVDGLLILTPIQYFQVLGKMTTYSQSKDYLTGFASGYGVKPAIDYLVDQIGPREALVGIRLDAGNPESAVSLYMSKHKNIESVYFDEKTTKLPETNYINSRMPVYYVARDENFSGVERFLIPLMKFEKLDNRSVGVYQVRTSPDKQR